METPVRNFRALKASKPEMTNTELLNSNNPSPFSTEADVVVAGGGVIGLCYAIQLKTWSPHLRISIFEKSAEPSQKIGESTLSSWSRFMNGTVMPYDYLLRIFGIKDGLQFYCLDQEGKHVTAEDIGGLDLSFQLDRRMSELFLTMYAQSIGINVYHGVDIDFDITSSQWKGTEVLTAADIPSKIVAPKATLKNFPSKEQPTTMHAKLVTDATGFARKLTGKFGAKEKFPGFNCDAYWAYFRNKGTPAEDRLLTWDYPATKHMCFPEGWGWFIQLISWERASLEDLMDLCAYMISFAAAGKPAAEMPPTKGLSAMFDCPFEWITSIGWAVRNDHKLPEDLTPYGKGEAEQKFNYFQRRYPTLDKLMNDVYELLPEYYGAGKTYFVRKAMAYRSPVVAGDGWFAIGNSAAFTNPLISPGINAGIETAYLAAKLSNEVLTADYGRSSLVMHSAARRWQHYSHEYMAPRLAQMVHHWYNYFRDHRLFEAVLPLYWVTAIDDVDAHYTDNYTDEDLKWLVGAGKDEWYEFSKWFVNLMQAPDGTPVPEENIPIVLAKVREVFDARMRQFPNNKWGRIIRRHGDDLHVKPGKTTRDPGQKCWAIKCSNEKCRAWIHDKVANCPICGTKSESENAGTSGSWGCVMQTKMGKFVPAARPMMANGSDEKSAAMPSMSIKEISA